MTIETEMPAATAPTDAAQLLRQPAMLLTPSGQQGQGFPSSGVGIESAQGIPAVAVVDVNVAASTTGADISTCPAMSK